MTRRGWLTLFLGVAIYVVAWLFGAKALYPVAVGLVLAPLAARTWVRLAARPIALRRRIGGGLARATCERWPPLRGRRRLGDARSAARDACAAPLDLGHRAAREAGRAPHTAPARPRPIPRHVRDREGVARALRRRGDEGDDRRPLRARALGGRSDRRRLVARLSPARRARSALLGERSARAGRPQAAAAAAIGFRSPLGARVRAGRVAAKGALADDRAARPADGEGARRCPA